MRASPKRAVVLAAAFIVAAQIAAPAAAQYRDEGAPAGAFRDGESEVLRPPPPPLDRSVLAAGDFRAAYARARSPRIIVFWNRVFSDEVQSTYRNTLHGDATHAAIAGYSATGNAAYGIAASHDTVDVSTGAVRVAPARDAAVTEDIDFAVEAAFTDSLASNGARLIDRSLAMRATRGAQGAGSRPNIQAIENEAATARADLLIEVLQTPSASGPTGATFKVSIKNIRNARVLGVFTSNGHVPPKPAGLVAGPGGFVRASTSSTTSPGGVGHELAAQAMAAMARGLR